ncbi:unnamed protein product [Adineta steineri]|uniref:Uncharacterized protein n=1 Tax=Adineta steineri TaxID=433720 RepID=A0A815SRJ3_9BILA|nr:unnamed protein product [Adineta steineri]CAF4123090.1 unnamed protein product [Adineta steineri]
MKWYDPEEYGCNLQLMTTCRDTPPIQTMSQETCLGEIIGNLPLSSCVTIPLPPSPFFVRSLRDNLYVTSSPESLHCLKIPQSEYSIIRHQTWNTNEQLVLSPVALVNVTPGYTIACPRFTLVGQPMPSNVPSLVILYNNSLLTNNISVVDVYRYLKENTSWFNTKPGEQRMDALMKRIREPLTVPVTKIFEPYHKWWSLPLSITSRMLIVLGCIVLMIFNEKFAYQLLTDPSLTAIKSIHIETGSPLPTPSTALHCNSMPIQTKSNVFNQQQWQQQGSSHQQHLQPLMPLEFDPSFHQNYHTMHYYPVPLMSLHLPCYHSPSTDSINTQINLYNKWISNHSHRHSKRHRRINRYKFFKSHSTKKFNSKLIHNNNVNPRITATIKKDMKELEEYETPSTIVESSLDIDDIMQNEMIELS